MPICPRCRAAIRPGFSQYVKCHSCGVILEDDRGYNMKLYLVVLFIFLVFSSQVPIYAMGVLGALLLVLLVRNMRFVERGDDGEE